VPLILLDLNMAGMNGLEFLQALRADPLLQHHVVFVWTTSDSCRDREAAYAHHVAGYVLKSSSDVRHAYMSQLVALYRDHVKLPC
jgi:CheY-like chemotaxis protein